MTLKAGIIRLFVCFVVFLFITSICKSIDTRSIEEVRNKDVLDESDFQVIDRFVAEAVHDMVDTRDFSDIASIRNTIVDLSSSNKSGPQAQYRRQFYKSAYTYISEALKAADKVTDERRPVMIVNLLILIEGLKDAQLAELAVDRLDDENMAVRYWAIRCLINQQLAQNPQITDTIIRRMNGIVEKSSPQILELMTRFASIVKGTRADSLIAKIADTRIKQYFGWTVKREIIDGYILKILAAKISDEGTDPVLAQRFAQLFSCVIQRYIKGVEVLNDTQKQQLITVIIETEEECIIERFGLKTNIKEAIESKNPEEILAEHNKLLGDASKPGELETKLNFRYTGPNDSESTGPSALPEFPER